MTLSSGENTDFADIEGYLLIPHELLHVAGYRLVGKRCRYGWGDRYVTPIDPMAQNERLIGLLFPLMYAFTAIGDLRQAYLLIYDQKPQDSTPLDFLFWPILTDDPKRVQTSALVVLACVIFFYAVYLLFFIGLL